MTLNNEIKHLKESQDIILKLYPIEKKQNKYIIYFIFLIVILFLLLI